MKHLTKTAFLSLVFLFVLLGNLAPSFAAIGDYTNLFDGSVPAKKLVMQIAQFDAGTSVFQTPGTWGNTTTGQGPVAPNSTTAPQVISYFKFNFQGSFKEATDAYKQRHWDHINDFDDSNVFLLRICDVSASTGSIDESTCLFSPVPYKNHPEDSDTKVDGTPYCVNGVCSAPAETDPTTQIYHYRSKVGLVSGTAGMQRLYKNTDDGGQYAKFNVTFQVRDLAPLTAAGSRRGSAPRPRGG